MMKLKVRIIFFIYLFMIPLHISASCWGEYPWGKSEITTVNNEWIKTIIKRGFTSYVEIQDIDGGQVKTQYVFLNCEFVQVVRTIYSIILSDKQLASVLWDPCIKFLGSPSYISET